MKKRRVIGQITIKRIGNCYAACISGDPDSLHRSHEEAERKVALLRAKHGRRHYPTKKTRTRKKKR